LQPFGDADLRSSRILVVDDNVAIADLLREVLGSAGFNEQAWASDPRHFFEIFARFEPDLVLLDLQMPHVDGFAIMQDLATTLPTQTFLPVVVLTADRSTESRKRALSFGASDFLTKPLDATEIVLRIRNLLRTRWLYKELQRHNEILEDKVRVRTRQLAEAQREILARLAIAGEYRDDATGQHTQRVGAMAAAIARELGQPDEYVHVMREAATLHDIGKIGIPDGMLMKPGTLTAEEVAVVKGHARIGASILGNSSFPVLQLASEISLSHHEHWDGTGYPDGLKGTDIPLSGRIVAVADVFDALLNERPYKPAWPISEVLSELQRMRGTHLDPACVDALMNIYSTGRLEAVAS
jgi:putative two-component system response regulator